MCQTSLNRQKPFWDWCWCEATKRSSVHSSGPHFNQDMWQDNRSPSISKMWWRDYGNASQKQSWVHRHSFWFHAKGRQGLGDNLQLMFKPPLLKEMSWITYFFYHYFRRTKKLVESIHVSLVVSVPWWGEEWGWTAWDNRRGGEEGVLRQTRGGCGGVGWSGLQQ